MTGALPGIYSAAITFDVAGTPRPGGSKRALAFRRKDGSLGAAVSDMSGEKGADWRRCVIAAATAARNGQATLTGPLSLSVTFRFARPKSHHRTGRHAGELRPDAPAYHTSKPDATKLVRALEDALTACWFWADDSAVVFQVASKSWARPGESPGATVRVTPMAASLAGSQAAAVESGRGILHSGVGTPQNQS